MKYAMLVYHENSTSLFQVDNLSLFDYERNAKLLLQSEFNTCWKEIKALEKKGVTIRSAICHYDPAKDMAKSTWQRVPTDIRIN